MTALLHSGSYLSVNWQNPISWQHPLNRGLAGWWLNVPHWQGGTVWRDLAGRNHGTLTNMDAATDWVRSGRPGGWGALDFAGGTSGDHVSVPDAPNLSSLDLMTLSVWANLRTNDAADQDTLVSKSRSGNREFEFGFHTGAELQFNIYRGQTNTTGSVVSLGVWHHFVFCLDINGNQAVYLDGALDFTASQSVASSDSTGPLTIGARDVSASPDQEADCLIDEVRIHKGIYWTAKQVAEYYRLSQQGYPNLLNRLPNMFLADTGVVAAANPKGPLGHPLHGALGGPVGP